MGWTSIKNGELLALAAQEFDAFITVDGNIRFQQNLTLLGIPIILLQARSNRLADLRPLAGAACAAIAFGTLPPLTIIPSPPDPVSG
jgi:hypothetical protein